MTAGELVPMFDAEPFKSYHHHGNPSRRKQHMKDGRYVEYESRPFIGWDGEGVTLPDGSHRYILFANSLGEYLTGTPETPLTYVQCFELMLDCRRRNPDAIHVIYGGGYDANMMMQSFREWEVRQVYEHEWAHVKGYRIKYRAGKSLTVGRGWHDGKQDRNSVTLYDVVSFFQCPFVQACDEYLGDDWHERDTIVANKARRSNFSHGDSAEILHYCQAELTNLVRLMSELRSRLNRVGIVLHRWDGPGAAASEYLRKQGVKAHLDKNVPGRVAMAARFAYAGGRFEVIHCGHHEGPTYEYDINSAYPYAMTKLPSLKGGEWEHVDGDPGSQPFAMYHVQWRYPHARCPQPFFCRGNDGAIWYPYGVIGWYWGPEVDVAREFAKQVGGELDIIEAWVFHPRTDERPFSFIWDAYYERAELKRRGDGAHVGLKLALNSLYGKLAQQVGWREYHDGLRLPPYHQLEWAGYVTSHCRAQVFTAAMQAPSGPLSVIAFETDALFTMEPLQLPLNDGLGGWKETVLSDLTYIQSGIYFATNDGKPVTRYRGIDKGTLTREAVLDAYAKGQASVEATDTRFVTMGAALNQSFSRWTHWETAPRRVDVVPTVGKRTHVSEACPECSDGFTIGTWHPTLCLSSVLEIHSREFPVEWVNPDPAMVHLHDDRLEGYEYDYG